MSVASIRLEKVAADSGIGHAVEVVSHVLGNDVSLPFPDSSVQRIDAGSLVDTVPDASLATLLLESRRVLRPSGELECTPSDRASVERKAALVGLEPAERRGSTRCSFTKPERRLLKEPLVSIVIPAFSPRFFAAALASALGQTWPAIELVVCDDSRSDEIEGIVRRASRERPIRYLRNRTRLGTRGNLARGLDEARGEFVKYLNDDDVLDPECVATLLDAFRRVPDVVLATSRRRRIDERGQPLHDQPATVPIADADIAVRGASLANAMLLAGLNVVGEPTTVLFRRRDFAMRGDDPFAFDGVPARGAVDMAMWATLLLRGDAVWLHRSLSDFRIHAGQSQQDATKRTRAVDAIRSLQNAWLALGLPSHFRSTQILARPYPCADNAEWQWHAIPALEQIARRLRAGSDGWRYGPAHFVGSG